MFRPLPWRVPCDRRNQPLIVCRDVRRETGGARPNGRVSNDTALSGEMLEKTICAGEVKDRNFASCMTLIGPGKRTSIIRQSAQTFRAV
ncbi:hypothetical protein AJ87_28510 [Rhizobium yanglingense]|nr:hypothetical protein AJ87_28510 [Rhizobium yanglingense]